MTYLEDYYFIKRRNVFRYDAPTLISYKNHSETVPKLGPYGMFETPGKKEIIHCNELFELFSDEKIFGHFCAYLKACKR